MAQKQESVRPGFTQEVIAILGIFLAFFLFLSLFSMSFMEDKNLCGKVGDFVSENLFAFVGYGAYFFVVLFFVSSFLFLFSKLTTQRLPQICLGLTGSVVAFCGLLASYVLVNPVYHNLGGFLGKIISHSLQAIVGSGGMFLSLGFIFLVSFMLLAEFSPYMLIAFVGRTIQNSVSWGVGVVKSVYKNIQQKVKSRPVATKPQAVVKPKKKRTTKKIEPVVNTQDVNVPAMVPEVKAPTRSKESEVNDEFAAQTVARGEWKLPPLSLLAQNDQAEVEIDKDVYYRISEELEKQLNNFGVQGKVIGIAPGPVVTTYEYAPAPGVKISKIVGLADDLALGLKAKSVRVVGSIPGKAALGIEIPNEDRQIVFIRDLLSTDKYQKNADKLSIALGLDVVGNISMANLAKMPHLLIAGATGAGKSVGINTIIASVLYNATPEEVRFLMIDPKRIELSGYEGIPHLLHPVVVDPKMASRALNWAVKEMERRYKLLEEAKVKSFDSYNRHNEDDKLPYIVIIVDELADLMMVASKDVEAAIARLAQMARAAGMHLILATQRPSVDVLTGLIKANFPTRISFKVSSKIDSRTILDTGGAESLLGMGDMLFLPPGASNIDRIHGAFISEKETAAIVDFLKEQGNSTYDSAIVEQIEKEPSSIDGEGGEEEYDPKYDEAIAIVTETGQASISMVQRRLRVGYNRAARMIETMEREGVVGPADGARPREVLVQSH